MIVENLRYAWALPYLCFCLEPPTSRSLPRSLTAGSAQCRQSMGTSAIVFMNDGLARTIALDGSCLKTSTNKTSRYAAASVTCHRFWTLWRVESGKAETVWTSEHGTSCMGLGAVPRYRKTDIGRILTDTRGSERCSSTWYPVRASVVEMGEEVGFAIQILAPWLDGISMVHTSNIEERTEMTIMKK
jgi:hypothetical protein